MVPEQQNLCLVSAHFPPWKTILSFIYKLFTARSASREFSLINKSANVGELNPESRTFILQVKHSLFMAQRPHQAHLQNPLLN